MNATALSVSFLFVPATRPERLAKAAATGALPVLDLEDAVAAAEKPSARAALRSLDVSGAVIRVNAISTPDFEADIAALDRLSPLAVMLPKAESAGDLARLRVLLPEAIGIMPLVETARGLAALREIAVAPGVSRLAFGTVDLSVDLGIHDESDVMAAFRAELVLTSRLAGIAQPVDGVCTRIEDDAAMERHARRAAACGFGAVLCIHPRQVPVVDRAFAPSDADVARARRVLDAVEAAGSGAIKVDGRMVDRPVVELARRTVELHGRLNAEKA